MTIWINRVDYNGGHDYDVTDWDAAKAEAIRIVTAGLDSVGSEIVRRHIVDLLYSERWREALQLYNNNNTIGERIMMRAGKRVYEP